MATYKGGQALARHHPFTRVSFFYLLNYYLNKKKVGVGSEEEKGVREKREVERKVDGSPRRSKGRRKRITFMCLEFVFLNVLL